MPLPRENPETRSMEVATAPRGRPNQREATIVRTWIVEVFAAAARKPVAVSVCLYGAQRTVLATADYPRVLKPELALTDDQETALASLVV